MVTWSRSAPFAVGHRRVGGGRGGREGVAGCAGCAVWLLLVVAAAAVGGASCSVPRCARAHRTRSIARGHQSNALVKIL